MSGQLYVHKYTKKQSFLHYAMYIEEYSLINKIKYYIDNIICICI